ncbi:hypothetical protein EPH95_18240 [Salicibibacter halophilus]|uniref:DUF2642 domain-containing protein n=1 Tax=Salicibibacter halophilus TaxID=2502791 RepID=A0A514LLX3_9BACI|nr:hypothetical protein [Salicibibacter halophilus]QDI92869.1 hypothetical protein EPH95_18240 [Salicibibacter halophilus]
MFENLFRDELANRLGTIVEIATDNNLIEGILVNVTGDLVLTVDVNDGYGTGNQVFLSVDAINYVRFPAAA